MYPPAVRVQSCSVTARSPGPAPLGHRTVPFLRESPRATGQVVSRRHHRLPWEALALCCSNLGWSGSLCGVPAPGACPWGAPLPAGWHSVMWTDRVCLSVNLWKDTCIVSSVGVHK